MSGWPNPTTPQPADPRGIRGRIPRRTRGGLRRVWHSDREIRLRAQLGIFRRGAGDPTFHWATDRSVVRAAQTPQGVGTLHLLTRSEGALVEATAWGPGAAWLLESVPALLGAHDDPSGFDPPHPVVAEAWRRFSYWRVPRSGLLFDALAPAVIEQKVTGQEAFAGYRRARARATACRRPGPLPGLMAPPTAAGWAAIPSWAWLQASVDGARSRTLVRAAGFAGRLEQGVGLGLPEAHRRMRALPGIGVWTAAEVAQRALGDPDSVSFGDYHVAKDIGWALTGTPSTTTGWRSCSSRMPVTATACSTCWASRGSTARGVGRACRRGPTSPPTDVDPQPVGSAPRRRAALLDGCGRQLVAVVEPSAPSGVRGVKPAVGDDDAGAGEAVGVRPRAARRLERRGVGLTGVLHRGEDRDLVGSVTSGPQVSAPKGTVRNC